MKERLLRNILCTAAPLNKRELDTTRPSVVVLWLVESQLSARVVRGKGELGWARGVPKMLESIEKSGSRQEGLSTRLSRGKRTPSLITRPFLSEGVGHEEHLLCKENPSLTTITPYKACPGGPR